MRRIFGIFLPFLFVFLTGCYTLRIERPVAAQEEYELQQHFFVFGLVGKSDIELDKECPKGVAYFGDYFSVWDLLLRFASVGIYTPRTVVIACSQ